MTDSRSRILSSVRQSLASARHLPVATEVVGVQPTFGSPAALAGQFDLELTRLGGVFIEERAEGVAARVAALVRERNLAEVVAWASEHLPVPGLPAELERAGITVADSVIPPRDPARSRRLAEVERVAAGLTGADVALADTGTLVLRSGPGRPRLASLSVQTHIAVFTAAQLFASWEAWWSARPGPAAWVSAGSNVTLISGPSRTADIEMTLTVGVHGPREVIAILIKG